MIHNFSPEVHVLAGMLVPILSTVHLVVRKLIGTTPSPTNGRRKNLAQMRVLNDASNLLVAFGAPSGISPRTPHKSLGDGHEQSPTRANLLKLL